jgi:hypothetical protein
MALLDEVVYRILPSVAPGRALSDGEWRTLAAAAETLIDCGRLSLTSERIADNVERFLCRGRSTRAFRIRALLQLLEFATLPICGKPFSRLPPETRRRVVQQHMMAGRNVWRLCAKVRLLVLMGAYGDPGAHAQLGVLPVAQRPRFRVAQPDRSSRAQSALPAAE